jgi:hypothetical protein
MFDFSIKSNSKFVNDNNNNDTLIKYQPFHSYELKRSQLLSQFHLDYEKKVKDLFYTDKPPKDALNRFLHEQLSNKSRDTIVNHLIPKPENDLKTINAKFKSDYPICSYSLRHTTKMNQTKFLAKIQPSLEIAAHYNKNRDLNEKLSKFKWKINNLNYEITQETVYEYKSIFEQFANYYEPLIDSKLDSLCDYLRKIMIELSSDLNQIAKNILMDFSSKKIIELAKNEIISKELDNFTIELKFNNQSYQIAKQYYSKLKALYKIHNQFDEKNDEQIFLSRLFSLVCRYESYFKNSIKINEGYGLQAALPGVVFNELNKQFDVSEEMFASPFNCYFPNYCSAFVDTDIFFGSHGSFFDYFPTEGSFECNPPFTSEIYLRMIDHIDHLLDQSQQPLSFIVFIPERIEGDDPNADKLKKSRFLKKSVIVLYNQHEYVSGAQHMPDKSKDLTMNYEPCHNTQIFFLQNKAGNQKWTPDQNKIDAILNKMSNSKQKDSCLSNNVRINNNLNESNYKRKAENSNEPNDKRKRSLISYDDL